MFFGECESITPFGCVHFGREFSEALGCDRRIFCFCSNVACGVSVGALAVFEVRGVSSAICEFFSADMALSRGRVCLSGFFGLITVGVFGTAFNVCSDSVDVKEFSAMGALFGPVDIIGGCVVVDVLVSMDLCLFCLGWKKLV